jgi:flagellum-specific ATP synthase
MNTAIDLTRYLEVAKATASPAPEGRLINVIGLVLEAGGCRASIGDLYELIPLSGASAIEAEVVGLRGDRTLLMPLGPIHGLQIGSPLRRMGHAAYVPVDRGLLGRVVNGLGRPLDGKPLPDLEFERPIHGNIPNALTRKPITDPFWFGIRAIDGMLTMGRGQRMGIFAGGGVGKSTLLGMMVRRASADVAVVALIGERGREVEDFVHRILGPEGLARSVVVAATSAEPPLVRARGALYATTIAEHFRASGLNVLLVMDSVTRYAMALREIGLAIGEPPTTKGYTPSVFASLPRLLERAGTSTGAGSITGIYTVLVEGDDLSEPVSDAVRAILDGQIVLSRRLAERGHFPAIDLPRSISRVMPQVSPADHRLLAQKARELLAAYSEAEDLVSIGAYKRGSLSRLDEALELMPRLEAFLRQDVDEGIDPTETLKALQRIWAEPPRPSGSKS